MVVYVSVLNHAVITRCYHVGTEYNYRGQTTVHYGIGGHVSVLSDYKIYKNKIPPPLSCHRYAEQVSSALLTSSSFNHVTNAPTLNIFAVFA